MNSIEKEFRSLGRSQKVKFISSNIEYASAQSVAEYAKAYLFDVLADIGNDEYIADYLRSKGYDVRKKPENVE